MILCVPFPRTLWIARVQILALTAWKFRDCPDLYEIGASLTALLAWEHFR